MKRFLTGMMGIALILSSGCNRGEPGGAGAVSDTTNRTTGTGDASVTDTSPLDNTVTGRTGTATGTNSTVTSDDTTTHSASKPLVGEADNSFTLDVPTLSTTVKQGETITVNIGINRGDNFDEDVTLKMMDIPKGVTVTPESPVIRHGEEEVTLSLAAAGDAALGDYVIRISGQPADSTKNATNELKVTVEEN